jgi:opacity protein-like surface antigen
MFVVGAEGDVWWSGRASSLAVPGSVLLISSPQPTTGFNLTMRNLWSAALSLRAGVVVDRALVYGKVGAAAAEFHYEAVGMTPFQGVAIADTTRDGLLLGVGAELALTEHWSAKLEYDHVGFDRRSLNLIGSITGPGVKDPGFVTIGAKERMDLVKFGVNFKL